MLGKSLSHYRILNLLGAGGMGEVYCAEDTKLGRHVALKVLPGAFTADPERLARFEREARALAAVDHPNIAAIYSFESASVDDDAGATVHFLIMQLAEGETLDERISRGALPLEESRALALQIAGALESAHEKGIIHRDLKPSNIKVDADGQVKILDFGLAKGLDSIPSPAGLSETLTMPAEMTQEGVVLGTAAYMSPEQARGKPVDRRTDIWAFGCVLYEMLTGKKALAGETASDSLANILARDPDWSTLPRETPSSVRKLLRRCLAKDPKQRLHDMADVRLELEEVPEQAVQESITQPQVVVWKRVAPWVLAISACGLALWSFSKSDEPPAVTSTTKLPLTSQQLAVGPHPVSPIIALSRDGSHLAYVSGEGDTGKIVLRRLDSFEEVTVVDTDDAQAPFFSPDGRWIGFAAEGRLKKVRVEGGKVTTLCDVEVMHGAVWSQSDTIIFSGADGLSKISAAGGEPVSVTTEDVERGGEVGHHNPELLPAEDAILFTAVGSGGAVLEVDLVDLETGERRTLIEGGGNARVLPSGHLAYANEGKLVVVGFDLDRPRVVGSPVVVVSDLMMSFPMEPSLGHFTISDNGILAYLSGPPDAGGTRWVWVDRAGNRQRRGELLRRLSGPKFSPDGSRMVVAAEGSGRSGMQVWVEDLSRGTFSRLTFERENWWPLWSPDGAKIAFTSLQDSQTWNIFWRSADGSGTAEQLTHGEFGSQAATWSRDGKELVFHQSMIPETGWDVFALALDDQAEPRPLLNSRFDERQPDISPSGHWLAYVSNETGRGEIYVRRYPELSDKVQISIGGGTEPVWSSTGSELFYREGAKMMVVEMAAGGQPVPGPPVMLFEGEFMQDQEYGRGFDVAPDDQGFVLVQQSTVEEAQYELRVVLDWLTEVESLVSAGSD